MQFINSLKKFVGLKVNTDAPPTQFNQSVFPIYPTYKQIENGRRYSNTDDVYSIIKLLSTTAATLPIYVYEVIDEKKLKEFKRASLTEHNFIRKQLQHKALEEAAETDPLQKLIARPNEKSGRYEFYEALYSFLFLQGEVIMWKELIEFGANKGKVYKLHFLYPQYTTINVQATFPFDIVSYTYTVNGAIVMNNIPKEEIIHIKYFNPNYSIYGDEMRGLSPLKVLTRRLERIDSNMDVSVSQMQNGGVPGIVSEKGEGVEPESIGIRKNNFYKYLRDGNNKGAPYFSTGDLSYIQLGLPLADMDVAVLEKIDFKKLCNAYAVSDVLFNNGEASTESNVKEMMKRLYTSSILPNVMRVMDALNNGLLPHYTDKKRYINFDLSGVIELQENMLDMSKWLQQAWWITPNEKREFMKFEEIDLPIMYEPLFPANLKTMEQFINGEETVINTGDYANRESNNGGVD